MTQTIIVTVGEISRSGAQPDLLKECVAEEMLPLTATASDRTVLSCPILTFSLLSTGRCQSRDPLRCFSPTLTE
jgi:hypothetical protein